MKYLEGSSFTVHVGGRSYSEGWERIFGSPAGPRVPETAAPCTARLFNCGSHDPAVSCFCPCHVLDGPPK